jgi:hypothetical protein
MQHLTLIYLGVTLLLALIGLWHIGRKVLGHILLGWVAGILGVVVFASKLSKPGVLLPAVTTVAGKATATTVAAPLPATYRGAVTPAVAHAAGSATVHPTAITGPLTSIPAISPTIATGLLALLVLLSLFIKFKVQGKQELPPEGPPPGPPERPY